jgi:hypothetical protein
VFVALQAIVRVFRAIGATFVTWLWTVNIMDTQMARFPPWVPGGLAVNM